MLRLVDRLRLSVFSAAAAVFVSTGLASRAAAEVRPYPLREVSPGLRVEAYTVFRGTEVERFPLEVLGVIRSGRAAGDIILARADDDRVRHTGIVAGMSGSPVYAADGRLLGAIAYAWAFSKEPIAGITPIEEMLDIWQTPAVEPGSGYDGGALPPPSPADGGSLPRLRTPLVAAGFVPEVLELLATWAKERGFQLTAGGVGGLSGTAAATGGSVAGARPGFAAGDAIGVDLLRGDASLAAIGTITAVDGDRILAFGHPFLLEGALRLPMRQAEIVTIVPNLANSFKVGNVGATVGTLTEDRRAGVAGRIGPAPELLPIAVHVHGAGLPEATYHYEAARQRDLAPLLVSVATVNSVLARGGSPTETTWRYRMRATVVHEGRERTVTLGDAIASQGAAAIRAIAQPVNLLLNNSFAPLDLRRIDLDVEVSPRREIAYVRAARLERTRIRPGESVRVFVDLASHRGPERTFALSLPVPAEQPAGTLQVFVGGGIDFARFDQQQGPGRYGASSLEEMLARIEALPRASRLYLAAYDAKRELSLRGRDYTDLPRSAELLLSGEQARDASQRWGRSGRLAIVESDFGWPIEGGTVLRVQVDPRAPSGDPLERAAERPDAPQPETE
jgi:hypothetical protein